MFYINIIFLNCRNQYGYKQYLNGGDTSANFLTMKQFADTTL